MIVVAFSQHWQVLWFCFLSSTMLSLLKFKVLFLFARYISIYSQFCTLSETLEYVTNCLGLEYCCLHIESSLSVCVVLAFISTYWPALSVNFIPHNPYHHILIWSFSHVINPSRELIKWNSIGHIKYNECPKSIFVMSTF